MALEAEAILAVLERHKVSYVLVGGYAALVHGSNRPTEDLDITPRRDVENLARLASALKELDASPTLDDQLLRMQDTWSLQTAYGTLDIVTNPAGLAGYADLAGAAERRQIGKVSILVASLEDVIRSKEASGRSKDISALPELRGLLAQQKQK